MENHNCKKNIFLKFEVEKHDVDDCHVYGQTIYAVLARP